MLRRVRPFIEKTPTNMVPHPIEAQRQLTITLYRCANGCSFNVISSLFGVSISLAVNVFSAVSLQLLTHFYYEYVKMPTGEEEWKQEAVGFIENSGFPCIAAWDGFHVYATTKLKNFYSFKKRYSISNMGLVSYNKRFLDVTVNAPGRTHDARLLRSTKVFNDIVDRRVIPDKAINLGESFGEIPLATVGDSAFPRYTWLIKGFNDATRNEKERLYNEKLRSARVVTENCYGMLKGRWRILYKEVEVKIKNLKYVVFLCVLPIA